MRLTLCSAALLGAGIAFSTPVSAQRVIEETLLVRDPTVATRGNWVVGGALEYWHIDGDYEQFEGGTRVAEGDISFQQPGLNLYAGYGDFTVLVTTRDGDGDQTLTYVPGYFGVPGSQTIRSNVSQKDSEIILRWLMRGLSSKHFTPYLLVGYSQTTFTQDEIAPAGFTWVVNGRTVRRTTIKYKAPLIGAGGIIPLTEKFGLRVDGRIKFYDADQDFEGFKVSDSGPGGELTGTAYYNFTPSLNAQLGAKFTYLNGGDLIGSVGRTGIFAMIGYTHRF